MKNFENLLNIRNEELTLAKASKLKSYFKDNNLESPLGYWKMNKSEMISEILKVEEPKLKEMSKPITSQEPKKDESNEIDENTSSKFIYKVFNPEGQMMFESEKLNDVVSYSMTNGICSRGWVNLSIRRKIPVMIGLGYDAELTPDFTPRVTKKYSGNYWRFTKEEI